MGGLIKIDNTWIRGRGQGAVANIDHITTPGVYAIGELVPSINDFGIMEVISPGQPNTYTVQILYGKQGVYNRTKTSEDDFTGINWE